MPTEANYNVRCGVDLASGKVFHTTQLKRAHVHTSAAVRARSLFAARHDR